MTPPVIPPPSGGKPPLIRGSTVALLTLLAYLGTILVLGLNDKDDLAMALAQAIPYVGGPGE